MVTPNSGDDHEVASGAWSRSASMIADRLAGVWTRSLISTVRSVLESIVWMSDLYLWSDIGLVGNSRKLELITAFLILSRWSVSDLLEMLEYWWLLQPIQFERLLSLWSCIGLVGNNVSWEIEKIAGKESFPMELHRTCWKHYCYLNVIVSCWFMTFPMELHRTCWKLKSTKIGDLVLLDLFLSLWSANSFVWS